MLIEAARVRLTGQDGTAEIERVIERYRSIAEAAADLPNDSLDPIRQDFLRRLDLDTADEGLYMDTMKAGGEDNSARLVAGYLRSTGVEAHYVDPGEGGMILSDEPGNARVLKQSYGKLRALRERPGITVFPGFFGYSERGQVVTFPRGGSDITGAILAAAIDAEHYENFTDVDSVFVANPTLKWNALWRSKKSRIGRCANSPTPGFPYFTTRH